MVRKIHISVFFLIILSYACSMAYLDNGVTGNGNVVEEERKVQAFHGVKVGNGIDVFLTQGKKEKLVLIADENLHDIIITDVDNGILKIESKENIKKANALRINLDYERLDYLKISSAGDIKGETKLVTDKIDIRLSSAGNLDLEIEAEKIDCNISSSGDATLSGITKYFNAELSSAGDLNAFDLMAEECRVRASSAGNARVQATESFDLAASSAGDIHYKGDGKIINLNTSSAGSIKKVD